MILNAENLNAANKGFKATFQKAFDGVEPQRDKVAMSVPSTKSEEVYGWLGDFPGMREWVGERELRLLTAHDFSLKNKDYEETIGVDRNAYEDDSLGVYAPAFSALGDDAASHPDSLVFGLLNNAFTALCYDGKAFFATDHPVGETTESNKGTGALSVANYGVARASIMSRKRANGQPLGLTPTRANSLLVVPPAKETIALKILTNDLIDSESNPYKNSAELLVCPWLTDTNAWFLFVNKGGIKSLIFQLRKKAQFVAKMKPDDENVFWQKKFVFGVDARYNAGYGLWQLAYGSTGAS